MQTPSHLQANEDFWHPIRQHYHGGQIVRRKPHDHEAASKGQVDPLHDFANEMAGAMPGKASAWMLVDSRTVAAYQQENLWAKQVRIRVTHMNKKTKEEHAREKILEAKEKRKRNTVTENEKKGRYHIAGGAARPLVRQRANQRSGRMH